MEHMKSRSRIHGVSLPDKEFLCGVHCVDDDACCVAQLDLKDWAILLGPSPVGLGGDLITMLSSLAGGCSETVSEIVPEKDSLPQASLEGRAGA
jgi:hypothetical protein